MNDVYPFTLKQLPYEYNALEPYIDEETMRIHHDEYLGGYINSLNKALEGYPVYQTYTLKELLKNLDSMPEDLKVAIRHNGGGVFNHEMAFASMINPSVKPAQSNLIDAIYNEYESLEAFQTKFKQAAMNEFGTGYAFLVLDENKKLKIVQTSDQDVPLMVNPNDCPILLIDVWEHAYFLKHHRDRSAYIDQLFNVVNWDVAEANYNQAMNEKNMKNS